MQRILVWFSCGAASAVAAKLAIEEFGQSVKVVYCDTLQSEHEDNLRFFEDVERWIGHKIEIIASQKYKSVRDVFTATRYMSGVLGARCTVELKKVPRFDFQQPDDVHIFGYTADELERIGLFRSNNPELFTDWILPRNGLFKQDCKDILSAAGIALPIMYGLGFNNNNCKGCVKATSPWYWNLTRKHFPDVFKDRAIQSRELGARLVRVDGVRIFLDELSESDVSEPENVSCGPHCGIL